MFRWLPLLPSMLFAALVVAQPEPPEPPAPVMLAPGQLVPIQLIDVQSRPVEERPYLRHLGLAHMVDGKARQEQWQVTSGQTNGTSRNRVIYRPAVILAPAKAGGPLEVADGLEIKPADWERAVLIRLNIAHYAWRREVYETLALVDPHFHFKEKKVAVVKVAVVPVAPENAVLPLAVPPAPLPDVPSDIARLVLDCPPGSIVWIDGRRTKSVTLFETLPLPPGRHQYQVTAEFNGHRRSRLAIVERGYQTRVAMGLPLAAESSGHRERVSYDGGRTWVWRGGYETKEVAKPPAPKPAAPQAVTVHGAWLPAAEITKLALETVSDVPLLYADFFYWQTGIQSDRAPGPGYNDLLGVKNQQDFFELIGFDPKLFAKHFKNFVLEYRAAVGKSGISYQPRRIVVFDKIAGEFWGTFDNRLALLNRNPLETPDDPFKFDATEQYAHLSNGLWAFYLGNADGIAQASAPDFIGHDSTTTSRLARIEIGLSCIRCHTNGGLQDFKDWYRNQFKPPVRIDSPDYKRIQDLQRLYFVNIEAKLAPGRLRYTAALKEATGLTPQEYAKVVKNRWYEYADAPTAVNLARAARELGVTKERLQASLRGFKTESLRGYTVLDMFLRPEDEQEPLQLEQWHEVVTEAHKALAGARP